MSLTPAALPIARVACFLSFAAAALTPATASADQFLLLDWQAHHEGDSHVRYSGPLGGPSSWVTPDYAHGKAYFRLEVKKKPNDTQKTAYTVCFRQPPTYACSPLGVFTTTGVVEWNGSVQKFWLPNNLYDWKRKPDALFLVTKNTNGQNVMGPAHLPIDFRITVWMVSAGSTFDRTGLPPGPAGPDAGAAPDASRADTAVPDAAGAMDAAGAADIGGTPDIAGTADAAAPVSPRRDARPADEAPAPVDEGPAPDGPPRHAAGCATARATRGAGGASLFLLGLTTWVLGRARRRGGHGRE